MENKTHWVFDLDGTLVNSFPSYFKCLNRVLGQHGVKLTDADFDKSLTMHRSKFLSYYIPEKFIPEVSAEIQKDSEKESALIQPFDGVLESLDHLQDQGVKMAIWTGRDTRSAGMILKSTGLDKYFDLYVGGTCVENHKPHPEGLAKIQKHWDCPSEKLVMVGDHDVDVQGAQALSVFMARVSWVHKNPPKCEQSDIQFFHVHEFHNWIKGVPWKKKT